jgi:phosphodiesterase/alkaline phosphatase D-like protein
MTPVVATLVSSHSVTLTGLTPATTYYFLAQSANANGVTGTSQTYSFTTLAASSTGAPVISSVASAVSGTSATITWITDQPSSSLVNYGTTVSYGSSSPATAALATSHSVTLSGLTAGATYNFQVISANAAGTAAASANYTLSVPAASTPSEPAPYVGYVAFWGITSSGITISWSTDKLATTQLAYGTASTLGQLTQLNSTLVLSHGVVLTGLTSGTTYYFVAQSADSNGVTGYSQTYTFTTLGTPPAAPPVISAVACAVSGTSATITWITDQPSSSLVNFGTSTSYGSSSSSSSALVTSHSITIAGLTPGTTYNFQVVSANAGGTATASANNTFATPAAVLPSQAAPYVGYVAFWGVTSSSVAVSWSTDELATTQLAFGTSSSLGQLTALDSTLVVAHGATLTGLKPGTTYYFVAQSTNASGVTGYSQTYSFTTLSSALVPFTTPKAAVSSPTEPLP